MLNFGLCVLLKEQLRQDRPAGATLPDFGMPSNHAQTTVFLSAYALLLLWHGATMRHAALWKPLLTLGAVLLCAAVGASRIYLGEHTPAQVAVGSAVGAAFAAAWYTLYCAAQRPLLLPLLESPLLRYFYLCDNSRVADVMLHEYEAHREGLQSKAR